MSTFRGWTVAVLFGAGVLSACQEKIVNIVEVASVQVSGAGSALLPGGTVQLSATPKDGGGHNLSNRSVSWNSSNSGVASVNTSGLVTATGAGSTTITAQVEGVSGTATIAVNNPVPTLGGVSPNTVMAGSAAFQLTVNGGVFVTGAVVQWAGQDRTTQFASSTRLTASITAADVATPGSFAVTVRNPAPGGGTSGSVTVTVTNPQPDIASFSPASVLAGSGAFELTVTGTGFIAGSVVVWNGADRTTQYVNPTTLKASILAADVSSTGAYNITVRNPSPGGGVSAGKTFPVTNPTPVITSISPDSAYWTDPPIVGAMLTVTGTGFVPGSVVRWQGVNQATTYLGPTSLRMLLSLGVPGLYDITVSNPAPGGGVSNAKPFMVRITAPGPAIAARRYSTCAVRPNGETYCWGFNNNGQLGDGSYTDRTTPTRVATTVPFISIVVGYGHACGLTRWGAAYCWGGYGALGSSTGSSTTPVPVSGGLAFIQLAAGAYHNCGITSAGKLYCWGNNYDGRLGDGSTTSRQTPVEVGSGTTWRRVFAGSSHTCAIDAAQRLYCWGANSDGQLGDASSTARLTPTPVIGSTLFTAATLGERHTCAVSTAGVTWCWGAAGQLGTGGYVSSKFPVTVAGGPSFTNIVAGSYHTCGVTSAGAVWCWGWGGNGQLGTGATWWAANPVNLVALPAVREIAAAELHSCALTTTGTPYCWGDRTYGALGDGVSVIRLSPSSVSSSGYTATGAGGMFSCALAGTAARCWGYNGSGQVGDNSNAPRTTPVGVTGGYAFTQLSVGYAHACALTSTGVAYCWGEGNSGQLGNGAGVASGVPVPVSGSYRFASIDAGWNYTCGVTTAGELKCWGANNSGKLGDGTTTSRNVPTAVAGVAGLAFTKVTVSEDHSCALTTTGQLYCWGDNGDGELGDGTQTDRYTPVRINVAGSAVTEFDAGTFHTCAVVSSGTYCWGFNGVGELGTGSSSSTPSLTPVLVQTTYAFRKLALSVQRTCGITATGAAYCWGLNEWGQLGIGTLGWPYQPTLVGGSTLWADLSMGSMHSCGVTTAGALQCWGRNMWGELGIGLAGLVLSPAALPGSLTFNEISTPAAAGGESRVSLSISGRYTRGLSGATHFARLPRVEPIRPVSCPDPEQRCPSVPVRIVR